MMWIKFGQISMGESLWEEALPVAAGQDACLESLQFLAYEQDATLRPQPRPSNSIEIQRLQSTM
jgi:hypothetical protein